ncbi:hypothetical protein BKA70DRAFT_1129478 [Coprinopsis sp. MPI-PUGE-AT-0042]|nr:hypothetical protein BKA70DRAFT_1129478 [Coprinopsis sp. MPI-PUGE-AT-0042]
MIPLAHLVHSSNPEVTSLSVGGRLASSHAWISSHHQGAILRCQYKPPEDPLADTGGPVSLADVPLSPSPDPPLKQDNKRLKQLRRWVETTVPEMVQPFLDLLAASGNLRAINRDTRRCACAITVHTLQVLCVHINKLEYRRVCSCSPGPNLVAIGYFPSSPTRPSVAVDIQMLEFMAELFVRSPPNVTAWSCALEVSLESLGYKLASTDTLRRKLASAVRWYRFLVATKDVVVDRLIKMANPTTEQAESEDVDENEDDEQWVDDDDISDGEHPSAYLQQRCPLCFGGENCHNDAMLADVIVCVDANFQQKRRRPGRGSNRDPPFFHPKTVFLSTEDVAAAKTLWESKHAQPKKEQHTNLSEDIKESGMDVPASALDGCLESFTAADEKRTKASTQVFVDTGVMGLLCRHDHPLWLVNMTTAGERQFYVLGLILKLFNHLPHHMTVGLLYDIGCQLHRSVLRFDLLSDFLPRIIFGISVFYAYGHQWPCQLVYHPRKCPGFGLSDGEGCERFWSMIKLLIPSLRVSGSFQRIFALDVQIWHLDSTSMDKLGSWLRRKSHLCVDRASNARQVLADIPYPRDRCQEQWSAQREYQTRPLARVSKNAAKKAIEDILALESLLVTHRRGVQSLDNQILKVSEDGLGSLDELVAAQEELAAKEMVLVESIQKKKEQLGVEGKKSLKHLTSSEFLRLKVNARSLRERLLAQLQKRNFEMERIEKAIHIGTGTEQKLKAHIETQLQKKQATVKSTIKRYNDMCSRMQELVNLHQAPHGAVVPPLIDNQAIYGLDVDNSIWDNSSFDDSLDSIPLWMRDDDMRSGIRAHLDLAQCEEEELRLKSEIQNLQEWSRREWKLLCVAISQFRKSIDNQAC